ncbi:MAG: hypothetical protein KKH94_02705 [Candidatus Omnitrophica bacterium]|nr:hypothetical protein [Candidatus Omnitrophota bacterium]
MKKIFIAFIIMSIVLGGLVSPVYAYERIRKVSTKKPYQEVPSQAMRVAVKKHIIQNSVNGIFNLYDKVNKQTRGLLLSKIQRDVGKVGVFYYVRTNFQDVRTKESVVIDFDIDTRAQMVKITSVHIYSVNGKIRYTFSNHANRVYMTQHKR